MEVWHVKEFRNLVLIGSVNLDQLWTKFS